MYNKTVMEHFQNPRHTGELENANAVASIGNPNCGDVMKIFLKIENGIIVDIRYKTFGCAAAIASSSMASVMVLGKTIDEALAITREQVADALDGLPPEKIACSTIAPDAIKAAIDNYRAT